MHPFSHLGVPDPAGTSNCYESMSRTPIRDRPLRQPLIRHSRHPFVNPAPHSSFRRRACPVPRYGAGIQEGWGGVRLPDGGKNRPIAPLSSSYSAFARPWRFRRSKACPVPRYGAGIQGVWRGAVALGLVPSFGRTARRPTVFILLCGLRKATVTPASLHSPESMKSIRFVGAAFTGGVPAPRLS